MAKTEQELALEKLITQWLANDPELQKFKKNHYKGFEKVKHALIRKKRIDAMVLVFKMLLAGGSFIIPGEIVAERCTPRTTYIKVDATTIMAIICGQIDRVPGFKPPAVKPEKKKYTHS